MSRASPLASVLAAILMACGGESTIETSGQGATSPGGSAGQAGASGSGSGSSTGGSGGAAGGGVGTGGGCSAQDAIDSPPIGFQNPLTAGPAVVLKVEPTLLELAVGPDVLQFFWVGPDLTSHFAVSEAVQVGSQNNWDYVVGGGYVAAFHEAGVLAQTSVPDAPYGPKLVRVPQCELVQAVGQCGQPPSSVTVFAIKADVGGKSVTVGRGQVASLMGWQVTNIANVQRPAYKGEQCEVLGSFSTGLTLTGASTGG